MITSGQAATGTTGEVFLAFGAPVMSETGKLSFIAVAAPPGEPVNINTSYGVWTDSGSSGFQLAARYAQPASPLAGAAFGGAGSIGDPLMTRDGSTFFRARLAVNDGVDSTNNNVLWAWTGTTRRVIARTGAIAPGTSGSTWSNWGTYNTVTPATGSFREEFVTGSAGKTAFIANLVIGTGDTVDYNNRGIWIETAGTVQLALRVASAAPGVDASEFDDFRHLRMNSSGQIAFFGRLHLNGENIGIESDTGIWRIINGTTSLVVQEGTPLPGSSGTRVGEIRRIALAGNGDVAFTGDSAGVFGSASGLVARVRNNVLSTVALSGGAAPGTVPGTKFGKFGEVLTNSAGDLLLSASLTTGVAGVTESNDTGLFALAGSVMRNLAREGFPAPGVQEGQVFDDFTLTINFPDAFSLNAGGSAAFIARLTGNNITSQNDLGIWAEGPDKVLRLIAREGDPWIVAPGDVRTISTLSFRQGSGGDDGLSDGWSDTYQLAVAAFFTNGTSGVFVVPVPEPGAGMLVLVSAAMLGVCRFRMGGISTAGPRPRSAMSQT